MFMSLIFRNLKESRRVITLKYQNSVVTNEVVTSGKRCLYTSKKLFFHEPDPEYKDKTPFYKHMYDGFFIMKDELKIWKKEVIETAHNDSSLVVPGIVDKEFTFENSSRLDEWVVTNDADNAQGHSSSDITINEYGKGVFQGFLNTEVPKDGQVKKTGYCNMRSVKRKKSFQRDRVLQWGAYNLIVFRVRGDGRSYLINLATPGYYDITWHDTYQYVLHTRGGPYWQTTKIPFSKFVFSSKGKIQDLQFIFHVDDVTNIGITLCDRNDGPFRLEIDYIGVEYDPDFTEETAYENYKLPTNVANS